jgi:D-alanyl-lipoteichoic acid acyltransferase DltB (MBOAT superfamily)
MPFGYALPLFVLTLVAALFSSAGRLYVLVAASILFYACFAPQYLGVLAGMIAVDYGAGLLIERAQSQRAARGWLAVSLTANLGLLAVFKYSGDLLRRPLGMMPLGLSFHTFQAMAYTIEVYRGRQTAERSPWVFALYIMFFPQVAAGPIERPQNLLPQLRKAVRFDYGQAVAGLQLMMWGVFQKYVVADRLGSVADSLYARGSQIAGPVAAFGAVCFAFQMLCDFGGYSDLAVGAAQVLGIRLTPNFRNPFHSDSMAEYWKRWHITLSSWMRDYVFFPACGSRPRMPRVCGAIMLCFLANALWHGARWCYLCSGLLHGTYRVVELLAGRWMSRRGWSVPEGWQRPARLVRTALVFSLMTLAFLFFRGTSVGQTLEVIRRIFSGWGAPLSWAVPPRTLVTAAALILVVEGVALAREAAPLRPRIAALPAWGRWAFYYAAAVAVLLFYSVEERPFIYFGF